MSPDGLREQLAEANARAQARIGQEKVEARFAEGFLKLQTPAAVAIAERDGQPQKKSQATKLIELATVDVELFHSTDREPFAEIPAGDHREIWAIRSKSFRHWLAGQYFASTKGAVGGQAMQDALAVLSSRALFEGEARPVSIRLAEHHGRIYLDLANKAWQVVRISIDGWELTNASPVAFRRSKSQLALPTPMSGGTVDLLREVLNIRDDQQWTLLVSYLLAALRPQGPYPVLVLDGEQGTGKSWIAETIKTLIDPAIAGNRGAPRDSRDLMIAATNGWLLSFDNLSRLSAEMSDDLCRLSTGGGLSTRELYSDSDEIIFDAMRPTIVNAIGDVVTQPDLVERSVVVTPAIIPDEQRRQRAVLVRRLEAIRPLVLGALLDAVVHGLRTVESIHLPRLPRMADFAVWVAACAPALGWKPEQFLDAYSVNRSEAVEIGLEASPLVAPLRQLVEQQGGLLALPPADLLVKLAENVPDSVRRTNAWPAKPNHLSGRLKRLAPALRATGLAVTFERSGAGRRIRLERKGDSSSRSTSPSQVQGNPPLRSDDHDRPVSINDDQPLWDRHSPTSGQIKDNDDCVGRDDQNPLLSNLEPSEVNLDA